MDSTPQHDWSVSWCCCTSFDVRVRVRVRGYGWVRGWQCDQCWSSLVVPMMPMSRMYFDLLLPKEKKNRGYLENSLSWRYAFFVLSAVSSHDSYFVYYYWSIWWCMYQLDDGEADNGFLRWSDADGWKKNGSPWTVVDLRSTPISQRLCWFDEMGPSEKEVLSSSTLTFSLFHVQTSFRPLCFDPLRANS